MPHESENKYGNGARVTGDDMRNMDADEIVVTDTMEHTRMERHKRNAGVK